MLITNVVAHADSLNLLAILGTLCSSTYVDRVFNGIERSVSFELA